MLCHFMMKIIVTQLACHIMFATILCTHRANWIKIGMTEYRPDDEKIIGMDDDKDLPDIGKILKLYILNNSGSLSEINLLLM